MKRFLAGALAAALVGGGAFVAGSAIGQGAGGTLGTGAVGAKTFEVRVKNSQIGFNCGNLSQRRCFKRGPHPANVLGGSGAIFDGGTQVGTALFADITGRRLDSKNGQDVFMATITFNNRVDSISVLGPSSDQGATLPYAIIGGTGIYAGARGVVNEGKSVDSKTESRIPLNFTFIP